MIADAFRIVSSLWPLAKEAFLWRDGAAAGVPITEQNLIRRKIAVFALIGSVVLNYFSLANYIEAYKENIVTKAELIEHKEEVKRLKEEIQRLKQDADDCLTPDRIRQLLMGDVALYPPSAGKSSRGKNKTEPQGR